MAEKPWIVQKLQKHQDFFARWSRVFAKLGLAKIAEHLEFAEMAAVDELIPWQTCGHCGEWFRDTEMLVGLCNTCRHPGDCPACHSDDVVVDWHFDRMDQLRYFVECHACERFSPPAGAPTAEKALRAWMDEVEVV